MSSGEKHACDFSPASKVSEWTWILGGIKSALRPLSAASILEHFEDDDDGKQQQQQHRHDHHVRAVPAPTLVSSPAGGPRAPG